MCYMVVCVACIAGYQNKFKIQNSKFMLAKNDESRPRFTRKNSLTRALSFPSMIGLRRRAFLLAQYSASLLGIIWTDDDCLGKADAYESYYEDPVTSPVSLDIPASFWVRRSGKSSP